jgi:hypothetical protein
MSDMQLKTPTELNALALADYAEATVFVENISFISRSRLRDLLLNSLGVDESELDVWLDLLLNEVTRRTQLAPLSYPFIEREGGISRNTSVDPAVYEFLLWLSISHIFRENREQGHVEGKFNHLVEIAIKTYLGPDARASQIAASSKDRGRNFRQAIIQLANDMNLKEGSVPPRPARKDGGVDVVGWRPFKDRRSGYVILLCQCTVQVEWPPKARDIVIDIWRAWIDIARDPITALVIPFAVPMDFELWDELRRTTTMLFDRFRLCELIDPALLDDAGPFRTWNATERTRLCRDEA